MPAPAPAVAKRPQPASRVPAEPLIAQVFAAVDVGGCVAGLLLLIQECVTAASRQSLLERCSFDSTPRASRRRRARPAQDEADESSVGVRESEVVDDFPPRQAKALLRILIAEHASTAATRSRPLPRRRTVGLRINKFSGRYWARTRLWRSAKAIEPGITGLRWSQIGSGSLKLLPKLLPSSGGSQH
jgi:hypothetical protein